ncbi:MAG: YeaH/YhbH family protein [Beijerinckiaceae bacterium]|nr:YeaH/YhbH family protein [Beijerinckiaceae bacterium]
MQLIDKRLNPSGKSLPNRQRFLRRARAIIKDAVSNASAGRPIRELEEGGAVVVPASGIDEPRFRRGPSGLREHVLPGNQEFLEGDRIPRPPGGGAGGSGPDAGQGSGEDQFSIVLSADEFLDFFLEDLELPRLERRRLATMKAEGLRRAGYATAGSPANLAIGRTMRNALARRTALNRPHPEEIAALQAELEGAEARGASEEEIAALTERISVLRRRSMMIPYIDPIDIRYRRFEATPRPIAQAVMFCLMDVSGSMTEHMKDVAKRFFMLLYVFLKRRYEHVDVVFIRHTDEAKEVDEDTFFHSRETGGTRVSTAFREMMRVLEERYPLDSWNIYAAQATDGDNERADNAETVELLRDHILPVCQYFAYIEVGEPDRETGMSSLWKNYENLGEGAPAMRRVSSRQEIYPVFRELFQRQNAGAG